MNAGYASFIAKCGMLYSALDASSCQDMWGDDKTRSAPHCMHSDLVASHLKASCFPRAQDVDEGALPHLLSLPHESPLL